MPRDAEGQPPVSSEISMAAHAPLARAGVSMVGREDSMEWPRPSMAGRRLSMERRELSMAGRGDSMAGAEHSAAKSAQNSFASSLFLDLAFGACLKDRISCCAGMSIFLPA